MLLGHKINGFFLVFGMEKNERKMETIYCDFSQKKPSIDKQLGTKSFFIRTVLNRFKIIPIIELE